MDINERMFSTMKEKRITQEQLANALKTSQSVVAGWKNRGTVPSIEYLTTICEVLGISWEYLVTGKEASQEYTSDEKELIRKYRTLNEGTKEKLQTIVDTVIEIYNKESGRR